MTNALKWIKPEDGLKAHPILDALILAEFSNGFHLFKCDSLLGDKTGWHVSSSNAWDTVRTILHFVGPNAPKRIAIIQTKVTILN